MRSQNVRDGLLDFADRQFVNPPTGSEGSRTRLLQGDLLITITGNSVGNVAWVDRDLGDAYISQHVGLVRLTDPSYAEYVVRFLSPGSPGNGQIWASQSGQSKPGLNLQNLKDFLVARPPPDEQRAIAAALSDVDALIAALDRLIAKKRDLKQAAMQQLLTGQARLPGFEGKWETKRLSAACFMKSGESITGASIDSSSGYPCYGGNGLRGFTTRWTLDGTYALVGRQGALCGNVVVAEGKFFASEHAVVVSACSNVDVRWLAAVLQRMNLNQYSESSAQPGLSVSKLLMLEVLVPPTRDEQTAIATVLSDMDAEITALEARRDKTRLLKQGMMQELLTGRTRLV